MIEVAKNIDLESYSSSNGYLGFVRAREFSTANLKLAIDEFVNFFLKKDCCIELLTSLNLSTDVDEFLADYEISDDIWMRFFKPLFDCGVVRAVDVSKLSEGQYLKICSEFRNVYLGSHDVELVRSFLKVIMFYGGVGGHCFIRIDGIGGFIYPHDEIGYGFIADADHYGISPFFERLVDVGFELFLVD